MSTDQPLAVARVLLDALTALDPEDADASQRGVPMVLSELEGLVGSSGPEVTQVACGAMTLAHTCIALVASMKEVDRLDVIAALRPLFSPAADGRAA